jgi:hypothetical protein
MRLVKPSKYTVSKLYKEYHESDESFKALYNLIAKLVDSYPSNYKYSHVLAKSIVINQLYSTNIKAIKQIARHISNRKVTNLIKSGFPSAVRIISQGHGIISTKRRKEYGFYSFATKYCHSHNPSKYPIYDRNVDFILWEYQKKDGFSKFKRKDLKEYSNFIRILREFKRYYHLGKVSTDRLDKFLWIQGDKYFKRKGS